jgi:hypothetical protein
VTKKNSGEASSPTKNPSNMKFLHFFLFKGTILACMDPDPNPLTEQFWSSETNQDPKSLDFQLL